ncbi:unnamed protein product [Lymnaea stagnalis]|uniref:Coiled-coil domain-containing protein 146 n=1 Tax=Lymnaea stagnalis TaxID=6523 RepID=A0AAV2GXP3_LYMST
MSDEGEHSDTELLREASPEQRVELKLSVVHSEYADAEKKSADVDRDAEAGEGDDAADKEEAIEKPMNIKLTPSEDEIMSNMEPPLEDRPDTRVILDMDGGILKKAIDAIKSNFNEAKVLSEVRKMYDLYQESQVQNTLLHSTIQRYLEKIDRYEARHRRDPRVMAALKMSQRHRSCLKEVDEEKKELQNEILQIKVDMKHMEDVSKAKAKEMAKMNEELRKLREIEKQTEAIETKLMMKENELQECNEKYADEMSRLETRYAMESAEITAKYIEGHSSKLTLPDKGVNKHEASRIERVGLIRELEDCKRTARVIEDDRNNKEIILRQCQDRTRQYSIDMRSSRKECYRLKRALARLQNTKAALQTKFKSLQGDFKRVNHRLEMATANNYELECKVASLSFENKSKITELQEARIKLEAQANALSNCHMRDLKLQKDLCHRDSRINHLEAIKKLKEDQNDTLTWRLTELAARKARQAQALKLSENNALVLVKELTCMHEEVQQQKHISRDLMNKNSALWIKLGIIKNHYFDSAEKTRLLACEVEAQKDFANKTELKRLETDSKLEGLMKTNIELYNETNTQEEIQQLQVLQFKQKNKEMQGLQAMNKEKEDHITKMDCTIKERHHQIETLAAEVIKLKSQVEDGKSNILVMTEEIRIMISQLRKAWATIKQYKTFIELLRKKRDLFGTKLIESNIELDLYKKRVARTEEVMKDSAAEYKNMKNDLYILKLEIKHLRRKLKNHEICEFMITTLRQEISKASKQLELEKARNAALVTTREPIIHRWRALLAADPSKYELYVKITRLTQRLISKTTEVVEKEQIIQSRELCFMQLRALLERRSVPSISAEMSSARNTIRRQQRQIQAISAELNLADNHKTEKELECKTKSKELEAVKKKLFEEQKKSRKLQEKNKLILPLPPINIRTGPCPGAKFRVNALPIAYVKPSK